MEANLLVVGVSHHNAPVEVRERIAFAEAEVAPAAADLVALPSVAEAVVLSTCNRVEVYTLTREVATTAAAADEVRRFLARSRRVPLETLTPHLYERSGPAAVRHVFRVASSLDSLVVGEPQILGQVKDAFAASLAAGAVGPLLGRCLERAFAVAKRVRTETDIARGSANVSSVAVELARSIFGDLGGRTVLVIGAGAMAELAARHLAADGADHIVVVNRSAERAAAVAACVSGTSRPWNDLETLLERADMVISSTGSPVPILTAETVKRVMKARRYRPIFLIDIAVPRDIEAAAGALDGVYLYGVDDLEEVVRANLEERRAEAAAAEAIVEAEAVEFEAWLRRQDLVPTIRDLNEHFMTVARAEAERVVGAMERSGYPLGAEQERLVRQLADSIAKRLLRSPLAVLKSNEGARANALSAAVRELFSLAHKAEAGEHRDS